MKIDTRLLRLLDASISVGIRGAAAISAFLLQILISRTTGAAGIGQFQILLTSATVISTFSTFGMGLSITRIVAQKRLSKSAIFKTIGNATIASLFILSIIVTIITVNIDYLNNIIDDLNTATILSIVIASAFLSQTEIFGGAARGAGLHSVAQATSYLTTPLIAGILIFSSSYSNADVDPWKSYLIGCCLSSIAIAFISVYWIGIRKGATSGSSDKSIKSMDILKNSSGFFFAGFAQLAGIWIVTYTLSAVATLGDVGIFKAAERFAFIIASIGQSVSVTVAAKYALAHVEGNHRKLVTLAQGATLTTFLMTFPLILVLFVFSDFFMGLFGDEFSQKGEVLRILISGQLFASLSGGVFQLLGMTGNAYIVGRTSVISTIVTSILVFVLIPFGVTGAAIALSVGNAIQMLMLNWAARRFLNVRCDIFHVIGARFKERIK
ncbi:stage V sporulation protein B [Hartmannibacter diazotrophicus]|uniref:Stage V sporulation protein B n=1 Tax=Hartmannibacter diazotrophicus TaxID=1482074 RepID=A0A2C9D3C0_9HYPH|nr:oligosaccharide flippase family protein [Hartmannibacter diazotrophicus]SON54764.1 stage V sporulation protein B [Hartmannibacter diazotrophicus]